MATDGKAVIVLSAIDKTRAAFASAQGNFDKFKLSAVGIVGKLTGVGAAIAAIGTAAEALSVKQIINVADDLNKLSQRSGIAVEDLSALRYAGQLADVSMDDLATGLKKLNQNIAAAARGESEQAAAFKAIGVSVLDASGKVRSADAVLQDVAGSFSGYADGARKVALANAIGGKSFESWIPLLNGGRDGLKDAREELEKFGGVIGGDLAQKSETFNDNLTRLGFAAEALKVQLASGLIDQLVDLSAKMVQAAKDGRLMRVALDEALRGAGDALLSGPRFVVGLFGLDTPKVDKLQAEAKRVGDIVASLEEKLRGRGLGPIESKSLEQYRAQLAKLNDDLKRAAQAASVGGGRGEVNPAAVVPKAAPDAPELGDPNAAASLLRKQLDGRLQALRDGLDNEQDLYENANTQLSAAYESGELSINEFYDAKQKAQLDFLVVQQAGFNAEVKALEAYRDKLAKPQERAEVDNQIAKVLAEQGKAFREAGQSAEEAERQRVRATESFQRSLQDLDAQLKELSGDAYGAALLRNAQQLAEAEKLLAKGGTVDPKRIADLAQLLKLRADQADLQEQLALLDERQAVAEEAYLATARARGMGLVEQEQGVQAIRQKGVAQLQQLADKVAALAKVSTDPRLTLWADQLALALTKAQAQVDPTLERVRAAADEMGDALGSATEQAIMDFESLDDVVKNLARDLERIVLRTLVTEPLTESLKGTLQKFAPAAANAVKGGAVAAPAAPAAADAAEASAAKVVLDTLTAGAANAGSAVSTFGLSLPMTTSAVFEMGTAARFAAMALNSVSGGSGASAGGSLFAAGGSASSGFGSGAGFGNQDLGAFLHSGGVVGEAGSYRPVPAGLFDGAQRLHRGGLAGNEVPAVLLRGEEVLTTGDPRHRDNGGMAPSKLINLNVNVTAMAGVSNKTATQQGAAAGRAVRAALARND